jgi:hypothetical protein
MWSKTAEWLPGAALEDDLDIRTDLSAPEYFYDRTNRRMLESKDDMEIAACRHRTTATRWRTPSPCRWRSVSRDRYDARPLQQIPGTARLADGSVSDFGWLKVWLVSACVLTRSFWLSWSRTSFVLWGAAKWPATTPKCSPIPKRTTSQRPKPRRSTPATTWSRATNCSTSSKPSAANPSTTASNGGTRRAALLRHVRRAAVERRGQADPGEPAAPRHHVQPYRPRGRQPRRHGDERPQAGPVLPGHPGRRGDQRALFVRSDVGPGTVRR